GDGGGDDAPVDRGARLRGGGTPERPRPARAAQLGRALRAARGGAAPRPRRRGQGEAPVGRARKPVPTPPWLLQYRRLRSRVRRWRNHFGRPDAANRIRKRTDFTRCEKPVLLIYGFMATRKSMQVMERRLRR